MAVVPNRLPLEAKGKVGVLIGLACSGRLITPELVVAMALQGPPTHFSNAYFIVKGLPVDQARNLLAKKALEVGAKYLWFVDDDTIPPPNSLQRLIAVLENYPEIKVIGGVYVTKAEVPQPVLFRGEGLGSFWQWKKGDVFEVSSMGAGCMLIRTDVFKDCIEPWFEFTNMPSNDPAIPGSFVSEDVNFCRKVRAAGHLVYAHGGILCEHFDSSTGITYRLPDGSYPLREDVSSLADPLPQESQK